MFPSAQRLILDVLKLNQPYHTKVRHLIQLGDFFNIAENTIRVTLVRLLKCGMIISNQRGFYGVSPKATAIEQELWNWRQSERILKEWQGHYVVLAQQGRYKQDQSTHKKGHKALALMGFSEFEKQLYIRPDNLTYTPHEIKSKLIKLGLTSPVHVFMAHSFESGHDDIINSLWLPSKIDQYYIEHEKKMREWMLHQHLYPQKKLIQESYLLCQDAIRHIFFDPLLPEPYNDQKNRQSLVDMTIRFENNGVKIWRDYCKTTKL